VDEQGDEDDEIEEEEEEGIFSEMRKAEKDKQTTEQAQGSRAKTLEDDF
jgi:hypothetical protein